MEVTGSRRREEQKERVRRFGGDRIRQRRW